MAEETIESLQIKIGATASDASKQLTMLTGKLKDLKEACAGGAGLRSIAQEISTLRGTLNGLDNNAGQKLTNLITALQGLKGIQKLSISTDLSASLITLSAAVSNLSDDIGTKMAGFASGLDALSRVGKISISSTLGRHLTEIAQAGEYFEAHGSGMVAMTQALSTLATSPMPTISSSLANHLVDVAIAAEQMATIDMTGIERLGGALTNMSGTKVSSVLAKNLVQVAEAAETLNNKSFKGLEKMANAMSKLSVAVNGLPANLRNVATNLKSTDQAMKQHQQTVAKTSNKYTELYSAFMLAKSGLTRVAQTVSGWIDSSNKYIENVNLFTVSMGQYAESAKAYAEQVGDVMGIDPGSWMRNQGVFQTLSTGFGVSADRAAIMSKNLTQLGYDLSSFFNIAVDGEGGSMQKLQAGLAGELEPLRRLGFDLSEARLKAVALQLGIDKTYKSMTQAEKAQLRYYAILNQVTTAQGDMARTLNTPANMLRVLKAQVEQTGRALGNIFIPLLNQALPYLIAFAKAVRLVANAIASLFGFEMPEIDLSGIGAAAEGAEELEEGLTGSGKAAKKLNELLADWDELNIIASEKGGGGGGGGATGIGGDLGFELPEYEFLEGAESKVTEIFETIKPYVDWMINHLDLMGQIIGVVGAGFLAWKIDKMLTGDIGSVIKTVLGVALAIWALKQGYEDFMEQWNEGITLENMISLITDAAYLTIGLGLAFGLTGLAAGLIIGGIALIINPLKQLITTGKLTDEAVWQLEIGLIMLGAGFTLLKTKSLKAALGVALAAYGIIESIKGIKDQWDNGVTAENSIQLMKSVGMVVAGLGIAFGKFGFGLGLVIGGIALVIGPLKELIETGELSEESLKQLKAGAVMAAGGITLLATRSIKAALGVGLAVYGITDEIQGIIDQWNNGVDAENAIRIMKDGLFIVGGLALAFGKVGLGIGLVIWGVGALIAPLKQLIDTGKLTSDALWQMEAAIGAISLGISVMTGSWIPILVGAIAGLALYIWQNWDEISMKLTVAWEAFMKFIDMFIIQPLRAWFDNVCDAIVIGWDWAKNSVKTAWKNVANWFNANILLPLADFFTSTINDVVNGWTLAKEVIEIAWNAVGAWFVDNVTDPLSSFFMNLGFDIGKSLISAILTVQQWWNGIGNWFYENVTSPILSFIIHAGAEIGRIFSEAYAGITIAWQLLAGWFNDNVVVPVVEIFTAFSTSAGVLWDEAKATVEGAWVSVASWFYDNVISPVAGFLEEMRGKITFGFTLAKTIIATAFQTAYNRVVEILGPIISWVDTNIIQPMISLFSLDLGGAIGVAFELVKNDITDKLNGAWDTVRNLWITVAGWFMNNVYIPVTTLFTNAGTDIGNKFTLAKQVIEIAWGTVTSWFQGICADVSLAVWNIYLDIVAWFGGAVEDVEDVWNAVSGWFNDNVTTPITTTFETFAGSLQTFMTDPIGAIKIAWIGVENFFIGVVNSMIDGINWLIEKMNSFNVTLGGWKLWDATEIIPAFDVFGQHFGGLSIPAVTLPSFSIGISGIPTIEKLPYKEVPEMAEGGFPATGELFMAREAGPELVGQIGRRNAVANNDQIDEGIAQGVRDANADQNAILEMAVQYLRVIASKSNRFTVEPSVALARTIKRSEELRLQAEGV